ncbi:fatty acid desaturase [Enterobacter mori]|uniref:Fatty acid desaturase n=1 Tax=Enterobacter mori TaxID=539813 RepID=A0A9Q7K2X3_9ENTR|nr:fatty acid desaturase [Enterobacter mori]MCC8230890.1 fatty acid desaturase [Enterobacter mori]MCC8240310.1 fatty acid desaturase [Enterobacter mori]RTQ24246.1 fatty acid desaturase [Enterobacter mori]
MSHYLHPQQREHIHQLATRFLWRSELPTWLLIIAIYTGWFTTLAYWHTIGLLPATVLLIWFTAWYMSLQHELIHGHPTRFPRLNQLFGTLPLAVWYPYGLYRDSHLAHHRNDHLTVPVDDPESYYFTEQTWARFTPWQKRIIHVRNTFLGRLLLAPLLDIVQTLGRAVVAFRQLHMGAMLMWLVHGVLLAGLFVWMRHVGFSPVWFVLAVSYPALALTKVRSFLEHRAADDPLARSVINEAGIFWQVLFLNLNYHSVHHDLPGVPWYGQKALYQQNRAVYQQRNHGFVVKGYGQWLRQFWDKAVDVTVHPGIKREEHE